MKKQFYIKGTSFYSMTSRKNTRGKYPSNCYEVGITNLEITDKNRGVIEEFVKEVTDKDGNVISTIQIKNSKFPIPMFDMNNVRLEKPVAIANDTSITLFVEIAHNDTYDTDYLVCKAIKVNEPIKEFNPFEDVDEDDF